MSLKNKAIISYKRSKKSIGRDSQNKNYKNEE
jgi:hypothetical protein